MFLAALNGVAISALIGVLASLDPPIWLVAWGLGVSIPCLMLSLSQIWLRQVEQFPSPQEIVQIVGVEREVDLIERRFFNEVLETSMSVERALDQRARLFRALLIGTPLGLSIVVAAALAATV